MSIRLPVFKHEIPGRAMQRQVQWYEFTPANSDGFYNVIVRKGRKAIHRVDVFLRTELIQSTSPSDAPGFDLLRWHKANTNGSKLEPRTAAENKELGRMFLRRGDVVLVRIEADLPATYTIQLSKTHVLNLKDGARSNIQVSNSTRLILDQGRVPCNFSIDFGEIMPSDLIFYDGPNIIMSVPIETGAKFEWTFDPGRDRQIRMIELSSLVPYDTNLNIVRNNG